MTLRGEPFARVKLEAAAVIRAALPQAKQAGARDALLAMCEASARRRDFNFERGDTLQDLAAFSANGEKRLKDNLRELASLGLAEIVPQTDGVGRDLSSLYKLTPAGSVSVTGRMVGATGKGVMGADTLTDPTRAGDTSEEKREERTPPNPRKRGGRKRDIEKLRSEELQWLAAVAPHPHMEPSWWPEARAAIRGAVNESTFELWLATVHPHSEVDGVVYLGADQSVAAWGATRFKRVFDAVLGGREFRLVACNATQTPASAPVEPQLDLVEGRLRRVS